ncbi:carboxypeptidase-like regulatory domain-containing protein [Kordia sp. YSTF-M3]|uniref:Carboxypeptidase-like regulatory domain-containing protein n=1 Tax=Kordia aestuariivivens TaxID=2759037 RepID=A0ABR7Q3N7_9FLAO|nr:carboxypeptidase-like regulatory domain-containing protein [Kordia aestuariivivens]MBC8753166.1 carboxypeptidase-like regulatory domain-containing protein [Kordia aestuariivivens]
MKTKFTGTQKLWYVAIFMIVACAFNPMYGQSDQKTSTEVAQKERIIKGLISDEQGPLPGVNITLKGTNIGVATNVKGEFTFPKALKNGDILLVSYLGYKTTEVKIKPETNFVKLVISEEIIEFMGSLNTNKRYKSKRKN